MSHPVDWVLFAWTFLGLKEQQASPSPLLCSLYHQEEKFQKALGATVPLAQLDRGTLTYLTESNQVLELGSGIDSYGILLVRAWEFT